MSANIDLIVKRLLDPQFGSDTTERLLMGSAADAIRYLQGERVRLQALLDTSDRGSPVYRAVERVLDEHSAWISRPSREVTAHVAIAAAIAFDVTTRNEAGIQFDRAEDAEARVATLTEELATARAALKPLADLGVGSGPDDEHDSQPYRILRGAIRAARKALGPTA